MKKTTLFILICALLTSLLAFVGCGAKTVPIRITADNGVIAEWKSGHDFDLKDAGGKTIGSIFVGGESENDEQVRVQPGHISLQLTMFADYDAENLKFSVNGGSLRDVEDAQYWSVNSMGDSKSISLVYSIAASDPPQSDGYTVHLSGIVPMKIENHKWALFGHLSADGVMTYRNFTATIDGKEYTLGSDELDYRFSFGGQNTATLKNGSETQTGSYAYVDGIFTMTFENSDPIVWTLDAGLSLSHPIASDLYAVWKMADNSHLLFVFESSVNLL